MKRSKVDRLFSEETTRKYKIVLYVFSIAIVSALAIAIISFYFQKSRKEYVGYTENSDIDYKVYLKENNFFSEQYLTKNNEYIASLIDYVNANFKYNILLDKDNFNIKYSRKIEANVEVYDLNGKKPLYSVTEELLGERQFTSNGNTEISINESVMVDYNHYNDLIMQFKETYGLGNISSFLTVKMYVNVQGNCEQLDNSQDTERVISLKIPLTTKTMGIEMESDLIEDSNGLLMCKNQKNVLIVLILGIYLVIIDIVLIIMLCVYVVKSRTPSDIYKKELKKILSNYHSFIQKINNKFNLTGYQVLKVDTFTDMLEIRDTLSQPILMAENKEKKCTYFIIPSATKLLYVYVLKEDTEKRN